MAINAGSESAALLPPVSYRGLFRAWLALCLALALHVTDEALTGFLDVYNPTVLALKQRIPWLPFRTFTFEVWLGGLIAAVVALLLLSPFAWRGARWLRPLAWLLAVIMIGNGLVHTAGTILGRTTAGVRFARPMPGFYSSPVLVAAAIYLIVELRRTRRARAGPV